MAGSLRSPLARAAPSPPQRAPKSVKTSTTGAGPSLGFLGRGGWALQSKRGSVEDKEDLLHIYFHQMFFE